jgi:hypothetical protein
MSDSKDLSTEVKTVLHGEILEPDYRLCSKCGHPMYIDYCTCCLINSDSFKNRFFRSFEEIIN